MNLLIHGLGQNKTSWDTVGRELTNHNIIFDAPNLFSLAENNDLNYDILYKNFSNYCDTFTEKLNLCGLSIGGILAIDYAITNPDRVASLILIGTPYIIPWFLFKLQGLIFKFIPKKTFTKMGLAKKEFIRLVTSMGKLDLPSKISQVKTRTLVLCGQKDKVNQKSAMKLHSAIPFSQQKLVSGAGHEVNCDAPVELANYLKEFWQEDITND